MFNNDVLTTDQLRKQAYDNIINISLKVVLPVAAILAMMALLDLNPFKMESGDLFAGLVFAIYIVGLLTIVSSIVGVIYNMAQITTPYIERDEWFIHILTDLRSKMLDNPLEPKFKQYLNQIRLKRNGFYFTASELHKLTREVHDAVKKCSFDELNEYAKSSLIDS